MRASALRVTLAALFLASVVVPSEAQEKRRLFEVDGMLGYTAVDMEKWAGASDGFQLEDWSQLAGGVNFRFFPGNTGAAKFGLEYGWQHLVWYEAAVYVGGTYDPWAYYDYSDNAHHLSGIVRLPQAGRLSLDVGAGMYFFDGWTAPALHFAARLPLSERVTGNMPIGIRIDPILDSDAIMIPVSITLGFSTRF